jgi:hypothetical protein
MTAKPARSRQRTTRSAAMAAVSGCGRQLHPEFSAGVGNAYRTHRLPVGNGQGRQEAKMTHTNCNVGPVQKQGNFGAMVLSLGASETRWWR